MKPITLCLATLAMATLTSLAAQSVHSGELIYRPLNPSFGGDPFMGNYLLNKAQSQDTNKDPSTSGFEPTSPTERLIQSLESRLLSQLIADVSSGDLNEGSFNSNDYGVVIRDDGGQLIINITDHVTGDVTTINVGGMGISGF